MTYLTTWITLPNHFLWPPLPLGGPKTWSKGSFWHISILSPGEKSKQNQSKNVLSYDIMRFPQLVPIPLDTQKKSTHYWNSKLSKNGMKIKFTAHRFFRFFFSQSWMSWHLFFQSYFASILSIFSFTNRWTTTWRTFASIFMLLGWSYTEK